MCVDQVNPSDLRSLDRNSPTNKSVGTRKTKTTLLCYAFILNGRNQVGVLGVGVLVFQASTESAGG